MLKSMTGYGQGTANGENFTVMVDMRSVNHRTLDIHWRAPQDLASLEIPLKKMIQAAVSRGRVDVTINFTQIADVSFELNRPLIRGYLEALRMMREEFGLVGEADLAALTRLPNVLTPSTAGGALSGAVIEGLEAALTHALTALVAMRAVEGHELQKEMLARIARIENHVAVIESDSAGIVDAYRDKLRKRIEELIEKASIDETRLAQAQELLSGDAEIGKKLDFLLQEINREANTILSKSSELTVCDSAIEIKSEVEKLREQAQNVE